jgi:hypothetical protein
MAASPAANARSQVNGADLLRLLTGRPIRSLPRLALVLLLDLEHADQARGSDATRRHGIVKEQQHVERITVLAQVEGKNPKS